jgi:hypothetical protein
MTETRDPIRQAIDLAVFAPIGLFVLARQELPNLIATGRTQVDSQVTLAKFVGKMAVSRGKRAVERRLDELRASSSSSPSSSQSAGSSVAPIDVSGVETPVASFPDVAASSTVDIDPDAATSLPEAIIAAVAATDLDEPLPIDGYDSLAASQVVSRLASLTPAELSRIRLHEETHRARRTILGKISQLEAS